MKRNVLAIAGIVILIAVLFLTNREDGAISDVPTTETAIISNSPTGEIEPVGIGSSTEQSPTYFETDRNMPMIDDHGRILFDQKRAKLANDPSDPEQISEDGINLESNTLSPVAEIDSVISMLFTYRALSGGVFPSGLNYEITGALLGDNKRKVALLSAENGRINSEGELVDQWGTPFFFHNESSTNIAVRSAGPDKEMFTDDDISSVDDAPSQ